MKPKNEIEINSYITIQQAPPRTLTLRTIRHHALNAFAGYTSILQISYGKLDTRLEIPLHVVGRWECSLAPPIGLIPSSKDTSSGIDIHAE